MRYVALMVLQNISINDALTMCLCKEAQSIYGGGQLVRGTGRDHRFAVVEAVQSVFGNISHNRI